MNKGFRKIAAIGLSCTLLGALFVVPASAHHGGGHRGCGGGRTAATAVAQPVYCNGSGTYGACNVDGCTILGLHTHDDVYYCNHGYGCVDHTAAGHNCYNGGCGGYGYYY